MEVNCFVDVYGNSIIDNPEKPVLNRIGKEVSIGAKQFLLNRRKSLQNKPEALAEEKRQMPFNEWEALMSYEKICHFHSENIESQIRVIELNDDSYAIRGNLMREGGLKDGKVIWSPDKNGRWKVLWHPKDNEKSLICNRYGEFYPPSISDFVSGCDPFDHSYHIDPRASKGASHVYRVLNPTDPNNSDMFVSEYCYRQPTANLFFEDMIMQCVYFGHEMFVETDRAGGLKSYFEQRGYSNYLMKIPSGFFEGNNNTRLLEGASSKKVSPTAMMLIEDFTALHPNSNDDKIHKMWFIDTLKDWRVFDSGNTQKFDLTMSSGNTLVAANRRDKEILSYAKRAEPIQLPIYDNSGSISRRIR